MRTRLIALIALPTIVALLLGGLRVEDALTRVSDYQRVEKMATLGDRVTTLVQEVSRERDLSVGYISHHRQASDRTALTRQYSKVDRAVDRLNSELDVSDAAYGSLTLQNIAKVHNRIGDLSIVRKTVTRTKIPAIAAVTKYSDSIKDLLSFDNEIAQGSENPDLQQKVRALNAISLAKSAASQQRGILYGALNAGHFAPGEYAALNDAQAVQDSQVTAFQTAATPRQLQDYQDNVAGIQVDQAADIRSRALTADGAQKGTRLRIGMAQRGAGDEWFKAMSATVDRMRTVEQHLVASITDQSRQLQTEAQRAAMLSGALVVGLLLLVLLMMIVVARSLVVPLRRLREGALAIAQLRLPEMVERLRNSDPGTVETSVVPIAVDSTDEIGEVARSFDEVHREAVRLAADEALLRGNVNAMFVNLSRRSQSLIERQLRLIDSLEQGEQDSERLGSLFKLDHLATRMRRNGENLLVLAGQDAPRRWSQPVPLVDVLRASLSEVEQYERVQLQVQPGFAVVGQAVNDIVHLVAELVENATTFSPQDTRVSVNAQPLSGGGMMLDITDNGIGMPQEDCTETNRRLAEPPVVDVSVSRRMGLFVVGRLATRHGIRIQLRPASSGGLTVLALLPETIVNRLSSAPAQRERGGAEGQLAAAGLTGRPAIPDSPADAFPDLAGGPDAPAGPNPLDRSSPTANGGATGRTGDTGSFSVPGRRARNTDSFPALGRSGDTGSFPVPGRPEGTGSFPVSNRPEDTGSFPVPGRPGDTGSFPVSNRPEDTGSFPVPGRPGDTGSFPVPGRPEGTGSFPVSNRPEDTGSFPVPGRPGDTGSFPVPGRPGDTGSFPVADRSGGTGAYPVQEVPHGIGGGVGPDPGSESAGDEQRGDTGEWPVVRTGPDSGSFPTVSDRGPTTNDERSPIFDAIESEWFRRSGSRPGSSGPQQTEKTEVPLPETPSPEQPANSAWQSPGDEGWQAAAAASEPTSSGTTSSGLPKRVPKANLVPGAAGGAPAAPTSSAPSAPAFTRSADTVRNRMSSFQQGVREARAASRDEGSEDEK